ncbi:MAG: septum formation initiator family protein [Candidatus Hydrogenedentes bacterium]|nr:septum formation initiator family protein [Candidatus Hydrogenedentota bacterium]
MNRMFRAFNAGYILVFLAATGLTVAYVVHRDLAGQYDFYKQNEDYVRGMREQLQTLASEEQRLRERVDGLTSDPVEVEADIRRNKGLVRPGEHIIRIEPGTTGTP